jgi:hypothetical protein
MPTTERPVRLRAPSCSFAALASCLAVLCLLLPDAAVAQSLRGSAASLDRQNREARRHDFTYLKRAVQLDRFVDAGLLVPIEGDANYMLNDVSYRVARPEVKLFVERLGAQYRQACGDVLVVTSLTRPASQQPQNASPRSVHPTGMALDLRLPSGRCRTWLESTLLALERKGVLDATLERSPAHFHVAIFPHEYLAYVSAVTGRPESSVLSAVSGAKTHTVRLRETLWSISQQYGTTPLAIRRANGLASSVIRPGQVLEIPSGVRS